LKNIEKDCEIVEENTVAKPIIDLAPISTSIKDRS